MNAQVSLTKEELSIIIKSLMTREDKLEEMGKDITEYEQLEEKLRIVRSNIY